MPRLVARGLRCRPSPALRAAATARIRCKISGWRAPAATATGIEHIDLAARLGDDVVLVAAAIEQRHLAEEIALLQHRLLVGGHLNHGLAAGDQIRRAACRAASPARCRRNRPWSASPAPTRQRRESSRICRVARRARGNRPRSTRTAAHENDEQRAEQGAIFVGDDAGQRLQSRRVADQLEQAEQTEHPKHPEIHRHPASSNRTAVPRTGRSASSAEARI